VLVPVLAPAFLASMDNYPISIFFTDPRVKTLPIRMLEYVEERPDPAIAAISAALIALVLFLGDRLVGLRRMTDL
jgi:putative spermidine/putrescine transport system permease protein